MTRFIAYWWFLALFGAGSITTAAEQPGLHVDYLAGRLPGGEVVASAIDPVIDHAWGRGSPDARVPADGFSARWTGTLTAPTTGDYVLYATSDDGMRVWVDGSLRIDRWREQPARTFSAQVTLTAGAAVALRVEYFEKGDQAVARLEWKGPGIPRQVIPTSALRGEAPPALLPPGNGRGLRGQYFRGIDFAAQVFGRLDPMIDFDWRRASPVSGLSPDRFSVRWTGQVIPRASGPYTFSVRSDDGVRLWVAGRLLIDQFHRQAARTWSGTLPLTAGQPADLRLDYYENYGLSSIQLRWSSPTQPREPIPASQLLYHDATPPAAPQVLAYGRDQGVTLIWQRPGDDVGVERYRIERDGVEIAVTAALEFTDTGLPTGSVHAYRVSAEDGSGNRSPGSQRLTVVIPPMAVPVGTGTGLQATYFPDVHLATAVLTRLDPRVDFTWGNGSPAPGVPRDRFSVRWEGFVQARYSEVYTVVVTVDDGARLWLDDRLLIDQWREQPARTYSVSTPLGAGEFHRLRLEYYESAGQAQCRLAWSSPREALTVIPTTQLYPRLPIVDLPPVISALEVPSLITGTSATMRVTARDDHEGLRYAWTVNGPAPATLTTSAAMGTDVTFTAGGTYQIGIRVTDRAGQSVVATRDLTVAMVPSLVTVSAPRAVDPGATVACAAQVADQFGAVMAATPTWAASAGSITAAGVLTAPTTAGPVTVTAQAGLVAGQATIQVRAVPTITWATPTRVLTGAVLSSAQLDASAAVGEVPVPGIFIYDPPAGTLLTGPSQAVTATFTPTADDLFTGAQATVTIPIDSVPVITAFTVPMAVNGPTAELAAIAIDDDAGLTYAWSVTPVGVLPAPVVTGSDRPAAHVVFSAAGSYAVALQVTDTGGQSVQASAVLSVTLDDRAHPTAVLDARDARQVVLTAPVTEALGTGPLTCTWAATTPGFDAPTFSRNGTVDASTTVAQVPLPGAWTFAVTLANALGATRTDTVSIVVPVRLTEVAIDLGAAMVPVAGQLPVTTVWHDQFGIVRPAPADVMWTTAAGRVIENRLLLAGGHGGVFPVTVRFGAATATTSVRVVNAAPVFGGLPSALPSGDGAYLEAHASDDGGTAQIRLTWSISDGPAGASLTVLGLGRAQLHTTGPGTWTCTVVAEDADGAQATARVTVTIAAVATAVQLTGSTARLPPGQVQATAQVVDQWGQTVVGAGITWSAVGGAISNGGLAQAADGAPLTITATTPGANGSSVQASMTFDPTASGNGSDDDEAVTLPRISLRIIDGLTGDQTGTDHGEAVSFTNRGAVTVLVDAIGGTAAVSEVRISGSSDGDIPRTLGTQSVALSAGTSRLRARVTVSTPTGPVELVSPTVVVVADRTPPTISLSTPGGGSLVWGNIFLNGVSDSPQARDTYRLRLVLRDALGLSQDLANGVSVIAQADVAAASTPLTVTEVAATTTQRTWELGGFDRLQETEVFAADFTGSPRAGLYRLQVALSDRAGNAAVVPTSTFWVKTSKPHGAFAYIPADGGFSDMRVEDRSTTYLWNYGWLIADGDVVSTSSGGNRMADTALLVARAAGAKPAAVFSMGSTYAATVDVQSGEIDWPMPPELVDVAGNRASVDKPTTSPAILPTGGIGEFGDPPPPSDYQLDVVDAPTPITLSETPTPGGIMMSGVILAGFGQTPGSSHAPLRLHALSIGSATSWLSWEWHSEPFTYHLHRGNNLLTVNDMYWKGTGSDYYNPYRSPEHWPIYHEDFLGRDGYPVSPLLTGPMSGVIQQVSAKAVTRESPSWMVPGRPRLVGWTSEVGLSPVLIGHIFRSHTDTASTSVPPHIRGQAAGPATLLPSTGLEQRVVVEAMAAVRADALQPVEWVGQTRLTFTILDQPGAPSIAPLVRDMTFRWLEKPVLRALGLAPDVVASGGRTVLTPHGSILALRFLHDGQDLTIPNAQYADAGLTAEQRAEKIGIATLATHAVALGDKTYQVIDTVTLDIGSAVPVGLLDAEVILLPEPFEAERGMAATYPSDLATTFHGEYPQIATSTPDGVGDMPSARTNGAHRMKDALAVCGVTVNPIELAQLQDKTYTIRVSGKESIGTKPADGENVWINVVLPQMSDDDAKKEVRSWTLDWNLAPHVFLCKDGTGAFEKFTSWADLVDAGKARFLGGKLFNTAQEALVNGDRSPRVYSIHGGSLDQFAPSGLASYVTVTRQVFEIEANGAYHAGRFLRAPWGSPSLYGNDALVSAKAVDGVPLPILQPTQELPGFPHNYGRNDKFAVLCDSGSVSPDAPAFVMDWKTPSSFRVSGQEPGLTIVQVRPVFTANGTTAEGSEADTLVEIPISVEVPQINEPDLFQLQVARENAAARRRFVEVSAGVGDIVDMPSPVRPQAGQTPDPNWRAPDARQWVAWNLTGSPVETPWDVAGTQNTRNLDAEFDRCMYLLAQVVPLGTAASSGVEAWHAPLTSDDSIFNDPISFTNVNVEGAYGLSIEQIRKIWLWGQDGANPDEMIRQRLLTEGMPANLWLRSTYWSQFNGGQRSYVTHSDEFSRKEKNLMETKVKAWVQQATALRLKRYFSLTFDYLSAGSAVTFPSNAYSTSDGNYEFYALKMMGPDAQVGNTVLDWLANPSWWIHGDLARLLTTQVTPSWHVGNPMTEELVQWMLMERYNAAARIVQNFRNGGLVAGQPGWPIVLSPSNTPLTAEIDPDTNFPVFRVPQAYLRNEPSIPHHSELLDVGGNPTGYFVDNDEVVHAVGGGTGGWLSGGLRLKAVREGSDLNLVTAYITVVAKSPEAAFVNRAYFEGEVLNQALNHQAVDAFMQTFISENKVWYSTYLVADALFSAGSFRKLIQGTDFTTGQALKPEEYMMAGAEVFITVAPGSVGLFSAGAKLLSGQAAKNVGETLSSNLLNTGVKTEVREALADAAKDGVQLGTRALSATVARKGLTEAAVETWGAQAARMTSAEALEWFVEHAGATRMGEGVFVRKGAQAPIADPFLTLANAGKHDLPDALLARLYSPKNSLEAVGQINDGPLVQTVIGATGADGAIATARTAEALLIKGGCFPAGTLVLMADGLSKPIESVAAGDRVLSRFDTGSPDAEPVVAKVVRVQVLTKDILVTQDLRGPDGSLGRVVSTAGHPFYVLGDREWTCAGHLLAGEHLAGLGHTWTVDHLVMNKVSPTLVYNFEVEGTHTYFVGSGITTTGPPKWVWVHNTSKIADLTKKAVSGQIADAGDTVTDASLTQGMERAVAVIPNAKRIPVQGSSLSNVAKSLFKTGKLPADFITKDQAKALGWKSNLGNLDAVAPGKAIGGDVFKNAQGLLPGKPNRIWYEADIDYAGGKRGSLRVVYSNDGLIYYTSDHYTTFQYLGGRK